MNELEHVKVRMTDEGLTLVIPANDKGAIPDIPRIYREIGAVVEAMASSALNTKDVARALASGAVLWADTGFDFPIEDGDTLHLLIFSVDGCQSDVEGYHCKEAAQDAYWRYWSDSHGIEEDDETAVEAVVQNGRTFVDWLIVEIKKPEVQR